MIVLLNPNGQIPANDRVAQYGDGCFTTASVSAGKLELLEQHISRLQRACEVLAINFGYWSDLELHLKDLSHQVINGGIKVIISRGVGGRGYSPTGIDTPVAYISRFEKPTHYCKWREDGISLSVSQVKLGSQPLLAGIKHANRIEQVLIKQQAISTDDVIVCDYNDNVVETSAANIFWRKNQQWYTPSLLNCGVEGVMRNCAMSHLVNNERNVSEVSESVNSLMEADEIFICNSLMHIVPVRSLTVESQVRNWQIDTYESKNLINALIL